MASVINNNWVSTPKQYMGTPQYNKLLTDKQKRASGSKWTKQHLSAVSCLISYSRTTRCNHILLPYVQKAQVDIRNNHHLFADLTGYNQGEELCRPAHEFDRKLHSGRFAAFYSALSRVLAPPATSDASTVPEVHLSAMDDVEMADAQIESEEPAVEKEPVQKEPAGPPVLEIESQFMFSHFAEASIVQDRINNPPPKGAPLLEVSVSRDTGVLQIEGLDIDCTVQDDGGAVAKMFDEHGRWTARKGIPRICVLECKRLPENVGPQHTAEIIMAMKKRLEWLGVDTPAKLERMDDRFLDVCLLSCQGKYSNVLMGYLPKLWCRRNILNDPTTLPANPKEIGKYMKITYDTAFDISTAEGRLGAASTILGAMAYTEEIQQLGLDAIAASKATAA